MVMCDAPLMIGVGVPLLPRVGSWYTRWDVQESAITVERGRPPRRYGRLWVQAAVEVSTASPPVCHR